MTCNNIILSQPESGATMSHDIPDDVSARLNFAPDDISGLRLGDAGQLVISFVDGGQLNITNFDSLIDNGNLLYLEDGTLIDPSILTSSLSSPQALNSIDTAAGAATNSDAIKIAQPAANTTQEVTMQAGQKYVCDFDPKNAATVEVKDGQMVLTFADGSQVVINNYSEVMAGELPAELTVADGTVIDGGELLTGFTEVEAPAEDVLEVAEAQVEPSAEQVANIEPAAGEDVAEALAQIEPAAGDGAVGNTGYGFNSTPSSAPLNAPGAIGPLGPTQLAYNAPQVQQRNPLSQNTPDPRPVFSPDSEVLDETALGVGDLVGTGNVNVNYGGDGPGVLAANGEFEASCNLTGGVLSSGGVPVVVTFDAGTNTYTGAAGSTTVFTFVLDAATGDYTYTQSEPFDHSDTADDNEDICLDFGVVATDADGDATSANIRVTVLDDAPVVTSQIDKMVDETDFDASGNVSVTGQFYADAGEDVDATYAGQTDGFEAHGSIDNGALTSNGVPVVVTFDPATNTYTGVAGAETIFTMELDPATGEYVFVLSGPLDHADDTDPNDEIILKFGVGVTDYDGDTAYGIVKVKVLDDAPVTGDDENTIDESDLSGGPIVINDSVSVDFGNDGQGSLLPSGSFTPSGSVDNGTLSHNGVPIVVTQTANGYVGVAGALTVFSLDIDPTTGDYAFTQFASLDHADDTNPNDIITLTFGTTITDYEGDSEPGQIVVNILDDAPTFQPSGPQPDSGLETVDETDLGPIVETGSLDADFGVDGPGTYEVTGDFTPSGSLLGGELQTCGGHPVVVSFDAGTNTYTGVANGATVFTLAIDTATGDYTYTQNGTFQHANPNDPNDIITLTFGVNAVDGEGEAAGGSIVINVKDDAPEAENVVADGVDETTAFAGGSQTVDGTITGHDFGNDGQGHGGDSVAGNGNFSSAGSRTGGALTSGGQPVAVSFDAGTGIYTGTAGGATIFTMTIDGATGDYEFTLLGSLDHADGNADNDIIDLNFGYGVTDCDGDTAHAYITVKVADDVPQISGDSNQVDESDLSSGPLVVNDTLDYDFGQDGPGEITPNGNFRALDTVGGAPISLTSDGQPVTVTTTATGYIGTVGGATLFTLEIDPATGDYTYTQLGPIDHPDGTDHDDVMWLKFDVDITDADGDSDTATIMVDVHDDGPDAVDDTTATTESQTINGNVITNDDVGADVDGDITQVVFNGTTTPVPAAGTVNVVGDYGTLTIAADGTYSYTANSINPDGTDVFTYTLRDADGDTDTANLSIVVTSIDDQPIITPPGIEVVDDTNLASGPNVETGTIVVDYGHDTPGETNPNGIFSHSETALTSCGHPVTVTLSGNIYTGVANGMTVFTMEVLENGNYTFTQLHALDHADTLDDNEALTLNFGVTASDSDGDESLTTLQVRVLDDGPEIGQIAHQVDEDVLGSGPLVATGTVPHDFGQDSDGEITTNGLFEAKFQMTGAPVTLLSGGDAITVTNTSGVYTGTANGATVFTLTIDPATGDYTYNQFAPIDHPDGTDPDDVIWLKFYVDIHDCDGDMDTGIIIIDVHDDGPVANNDSRSTEEGDTINGNVMTNDDVGVDVNGAITQVVFNGTTTAVPASGTVNVVGSYGTLTIAANGAYTYVTNNNNPDGTDVFTYTLQDFDGDTDTANLSIAVSPDMAPINITGSGSTDDTVVEDNGSEVETGAINVNYQGDGPGTTTGNGSFSSNGNQEGGTLSHDGVPVNVTFNAGNNTYTGTAGGATIFTMTINANGTYRFTQFDNLDHSLTNNHNEALNLRFGVTATDSDGDTGNGTVTISVRDDGPRAFNDSASSTGRSASTNVLTNDDAGADNGDVDVISFVYNGTNYNITGSNRTINLGNGSSFRLDQDGDAYFTARSNTTSGSGNESSTTVRADSVTVTYTMRDGDGDISTAQLVLSGRYTQTTRWWDFGGDGDGGDGDGGDGCPLVIDLDGDGIELISKEDGVLFDIDEDGIADQTAWVGADDGILVRDVNEDGIINDHSEMFGNDEIGGFEMLAQYDDNNDGVIDAQDAVWSTLAIWQDRNGDAFSQADEFITFDELGITAISLAVREVNVVIAGNDVTVVGDFITEDGGSYDGYDAWFQYDSAAGPVTASAEADNFIFQAISDSAIEINNFDAAEDTVDLSALIQGVDDISDAINEFVFITEEDGATIISVDVDGAAGPAEAVEVAKLEGVSADDIISSDSVVI